MIAFATHPIASPESRAEAIRLLVGMYGYSPHEPLDRVLYRATLFRLGAMLGVDVGELSENFQTRTGVKR